MQDDKQSMNNQTTSSEPEREDATTDSWPLKMNKALIAIGVIAFGLIVTDRLLEAFRADDAPVVISIEGSTENGSDASAQNLLSEADKVQPQVSESLVELQNLIGARVVFVSATEPGYIVTEDERRIQMKEAVTDEATLAGVTTHQVILEKKGGELRVFNLPDAVVQ